MGGETQLAAGVVLGSVYELVAEIGSGGMGTVWRARHLRLPKEVAIKVVREALGADADAIARFRREAQAAAEIAHPHIVGVHDFDTLDDGSPYMVLDLLEGESLRQRLTRGRLGLAEALLVTRQVASALHAAHAKGVVHRDLKPENIYLCAVGEGETHAKVLDFGISKMLRRGTALTQEGSIIGTPHYMAPEQAKGLEIDHRADQFALGIIVYEMLAGRVPFDAEQPLQVLYQVVLEEPAPLAERRPDLPAGVVDAVRRAMAKDAAERFDDVRAFADALGRAAGLVPLGTGEQLLDPNTGPPRPRVVPPTMEQTPPGGGLALAETMASPQPGTLSTGAADAAMAQTMPSAQPGALASVGRAAADAGPAAAAATPPPGALVTATETPRSRARIFAVIGAAIGLLGGAAAAWWALTPPPGAGPGSAAAAGGSAAGNSAVAGRDSGTTAASGKGLATAAPDAGAKRAAADARPRTTKRPPKRPPRPREVAPTEQQKLGYATLKQAKRAFAASRLDRAKVLAQRAARRLRGRGLQAVLALLTRIDCARQDSAAAKAWFRRVHGRRRRALVRYCRRRGLPDFP